MSWPFLKPKPDTAAQFKKYFGKNLWDYWEPLFGFDIVKFDEFLETPDDLSIKEYLEKEYGEDAMKLIQSILDEEIAAVNTTEL